MIKNKTHLKLMVLNSSPAKLARKMGNSIISLSNPIDTLIDKTRERKQEKFAYQCETMSGIDD